MRERIARAIDPESWALIDAMPANDSARAALIAAELLRATVVLMAMREPTGLMKDAGAASYGIGNTAIGLPVTVLDGQPSKAWRAMIDAAAAT